MRLFRGVFAFFMALLVFVLVVIYPVATTVNDEFLSNTFYSEDLKAAGTYDAAYDALMMEAKAQIDGAIAEQPNMDQEMADWVYTSLASVLTRDYVVNLLEQNMAGTVDYLTGRATELPTFDLEPKYEELRTEMAAGLTLDTVAKISGLTVDGVAESMLMILGIVKADGTINPVLANQAMKAVFDSNEALKEPFMMKSVVDVMAYTGNENAEKDIDTVKKWVTFFHKGILPLLMVLSFMTTVLFLMHLKRLRTGFKLNGWAYALGGGVIVALGTVLYQAKGGLYGKLMATLAKPLAGFRDMISIDALIQPFGKALAGKGLIFLGIGVGLLLLSKLFSRRAVFVNGRGKNKGNPEMMA